MAAKLRRSVAILLLFALICSSTGAFAQSEPFPFTSASRYDFMGRLVGTISADPDDYGVTDNGPLAFAAVRNTYLSSRLVTIEQGQLSSWQSEAVLPKDWPSAIFTVYRRVEFTYDDAGRKTREVVKGQDSVIKAVTEYSYDAAGRLRCTATRMNNSVWGIATDACTPQLVSSTNGADRIRMNIYDDAGRLLQVREGVGATENGVSIEAAEATYKYTLNGQKTEVIDANGNRAKLTYDGYDRLEYWFLPSKTRPTGFIDNGTWQQAIDTAGAASTDDYEKYVYDANGNRTSLRKRDGTTLTFTYDNLNRTTLKVVSDGCPPIKPAGTGCAPATATRDVYYDYDARGLMTKARFDGLGGPGLTNEYDAVGNLQWTSNDLSGAARKLWYEYDSNGNRSKVIHPAGGTFFGYTYDRLNRMTGVTENGTTQATFTYKPQGPLGQLSRANGRSTDHTFDTLSRIKILSTTSSGSPQNVSFTVDYNPASQVVQRVLNNNAYVYTDNWAVNRNYTTNGLNQYTAAGGASFTFDANGSLSSQSTPTSGTSFIYDVENRLVSTSDGATLNYDPMGRLWQISSPGAGATQFLYDGDELVAEYDSNGAIKARYVHGRANDDPLIWYDGPTLASRRFIETDLQGSVIHQSDASGASLGVNTYDEYGIPGSNNRGRFQYTGQAWLPELGMYYYKARIYSPTLGRFLQVDPIGYDDQINLYEYVGDDPTNMTDPSGEQTVCPSNGRNSDACPPAPPEGESIVVVGKRPAKDRPGGSISAAHALCRACHGVGTTADRRYTTEQENELLADLATTLTGVRWIRAPNGAYKVYRAVKAGRKIPGLKGGRRFHNYEGKLPAGGRYREYDVNPSGPKGRDGERVVYDEITGAAWYTKDHYKSFIPM